MLDIPFSKGGVGYHTVSGRRVGRRFEVHDRKRTFRGWAHRKKGVTKRGASKVQVSHGTAGQTVGGLTLADLYIKKKGESGNKVVSLKKHNQAKKKYPKSGAKRWLTACQDARSSLGLDPGFFCYKGSEEYRLAKAAMKGTSMKGTSTKGTYTKGKIANAEELKYTKGGYPSQKQMNAAIAKKKKAAASKRKGATKKKATKFIGPAVPQTF